MDYTSMELLHCWPLSGDRSLAAEKAAYGCSRSLRRATSASLIRNVVSDARGSYRYQRKRGLVTTLFLTEKNSRSSKQNEHLFSETGPVERGKFLFHVEQAVLSVGDLSEHFSKLLVQADLLFSKLKPAVRWRRRPISVVLSYETKCMRTVTLADVPHKGGLGPKVSILRRQK